MELILLASSLNTLLPKLWEHGRDQSKKKYAINIHLKDIEVLSARLLRAIEDPKFKGVGSQHAFNLKWEARIVSQNTLDSIQLFFRDKKASHTEFEEKTKDHRKVIKDLCQRIEEYTPQEEAPKKPLDPCGTDHMAMDETVDEVLELTKLPPNGGRKVISIVGFPGLGKTIIAKLVFDKHKAAPENRHLGTLRASVTAASKDATEVLREILEGLREDESLGLEKISLGKPTLEKLSRMELGKLLTDRLQGKRYFIVIDDMQSSKQWKNMQKAFPTDGDGTIIVTTSIQSVANACSTLKGYLYNLSALDAQKSLDLFMKDRTSWPRDSEKNNTELDMLLKKCDGLPLAIVSMSEILEGTPRGVSPSDACRIALTKLSTCLFQGGDGLERLRWVLMNKFTGLSCDALRSCLLYYCLYKHNMDDVPRRNSLIRRWEAEGFLVARNKERRPRDIAAENLNDLVDHNIMQSMEVGTNGITRRCRPPGMMLEYISSISMSENFAASVSDVVPSGIRRLSFSPGSATDVKKMSDEDLKLVLTLEVSGIGCEAIPDFKKYDLLAVLGLKECTNLNDSHVKDICNLLLLKYLSLGNSIGEIPEAIGGLKLLETLEMRRDDTVLVHEELLDLPNLKHLLGNFQLEKKWDKKKLENFLSGESGIETVTGFVTNTARGFPKLMHHMKRIRKVKIYCTPTATDEDQKDLQKEIMAFTREGTNDSRIKRSLSVDFAKFTPGIQQRRGRGFAPFFQRKKLATGIQQSRTLPLELLKEAGSLDSLKLRGDWIPLLSYDSNCGPFISVDGRDIPDFTKITGITKLCLSGTHLSGKDVLGSLTHFTALAYLKLEEEDLGPLEIKSNTFNQLTRLCLVGETKLHGITIEPKALPSLQSLHLISEHMDHGLESSIQSGGVMALDEIAIMDCKNISTGTPQRSDGGLDAKIAPNHTLQVDTSIKGHWKRAAEGHPNRPQVLLIKKGAPIRRA